MNVKTYSSAPQSMQQLGLLKNILVDRIMLNNCLFLLDLFSTDQLHFAVFMRLLILEDILYVELALKN
jgi:hypothetical protein